MIALAVKEAIDRLYPGQYVVDVIDFAKEAGAHREDRAIKDIWDFALAHPKFTNNVNALIDTFNILTRSNLVTRVLFQSFVRKGARYIQEYKPDIVFSTHFFCTSVALFARIKYHFQYKVIGFMADPVSGHNLWVNPIVDTIIAATKEARRYLVSMGEPRRKIRVMSFPLNLKFFDRIDRTREQILADLGLDHSLRTVIVSAGGQGIGETGKYIRFLYEKQYPLNIIAVCAKNTGLMEELSALSKDLSSKARLAVLGFVDNMHELLHASDFGITKAGPSAIFEHLTKGVPPIITHHAGLQEKGNMEFCVKNRLGWHVKNEEALGKLLDRILGTNLLEEYRENIRNNEYVKSLPQAPYEIAKFIVAELSTKRKPQRAGRGSALRALVLGTRISLYRMRMKSGRTRYKYNSIKNQ